MSNQARASRIRFDSAAAPTQPDAVPPFQRHRVLSSSESGLHYVRDSSNGILRLLTDQELQDLYDPRSCESCGEQFGCEHYNLAGEPMLSEEDVETEVPEQWRQFARTEGVSREDLRRLAEFTTSENEYVLPTGVSHDLRTIELLLLLNDSR